MNGYNFSERVRRVLVSAVDEARQRQHEYVGTEHLLLGLLRERDGVATAVLAAGHLDVVAVRHELDAHLRPGTVASPSGFTLPYTSRAKKVLELAMTEARELNHTYLGTEHLLLGLLHEATGVGAQVLTHFGLSLAGAREETLRLLGPVAAPVERPGPSRSIAGIAIEVRFADGTVVHEQFEAVVPAIGFLTKQV